MGFFIVGSLISLAFTYETPSQLSGLERDDRGKSEIPIELVVVEQPEVEDPVVRSIPKWKPAVLRGEKVRSYMRVPINFVLQP